jgi:hypothetical protein
MTVPSGPVDSWCNIAIALIDPRCAVTFLPRGNLSLPLRTKALQVKAVAVDHLFQAEGHANLNAAAVFVEFFQQNKVRSAHKALGEALFFVEGGRMQGELIYEPLCALEQRLFAHQFGLPLNKWDDLRFLVEKALLEGVIDRVREEGLRQHYAQEKLQLIAQEGA